MRRSDQATSSPPADHPRPIHPFAEPTPEAKAGEAAAPGARAPAGDRGREAWIQWASAVLQEE